MPSKPALAIFDFCGTLIGMQTADPFVLGLSRRNPSLKRHTLEFMRICMLKSGALRGRKHKMFLLRQVAGIHLDEARDYAETYLRETLLAKENSPVVERMEWHKERGDHVAIVSAGYENYIRAYAQHYNIRSIAATKIEEQGGFLTGKILKKDCIGVEKLHRLSKLLDLSSFDLQNSYAYGDHVSDIPLLALVGNRVVIESGQDISWGRIIGCELLSV